MFPRKPLAIWQGFAQGSAIAEIGFAGCAGLGNDCLGRLTWRHPFPSGKTVTFPFPRPGPHAGQAIFSLDPMRGKPPIG